MIKRFRPVRVASAAWRPTSYRRSSASPRLHVDPAITASASTLRPGVAPHPCLRESVCQSKSAGLLFQYRQASSSASDSHGGLNHTALHELHVRKGGKMVPFAGYSMPVQYSDLGVGESHKWTREKASLFDVGHM